MELNCSTNDLLIQSLHWKNKRWIFYGYIQCDLVVPGELKDKFANFIPTFKNTEIRRNNIGENVQIFSNEIDLLKHPQKIVISSFKLENGSIITLLFNFYMELGLQCTRIYRFFYSFLLANASTILSSQLLMLGGKVIRTLHLELLQKL